jgi:hypothetical protein
MNYCVLETFLHIPSVHKIPTIPEYRNIPRSNKDMLTNAKLKIGNTGQKIAWTGRSP